MIPGTITVQFLGGKRGKTHTHTHTKSSDFDDKMMIYPTNKNQMFIINILDVKVYKMNSTFFVYFNHSLNKSKSKNKKSCNMLYTVANSTRADVQHQFSSINQKKNEKEFNLDTQLMSVLHDDSNRFFFSVVAKTTVIKKLFCFVFRLLLLLLFE